MPRNVPQAAHVEDYDSDNSSVKPNTRKSARRRTTTSSGPPKTLERYSRSRRDGASDSGYSSHASVGQRNAAATMPPPPAPVQAPARPATAQGTGKSKPIIHRSDSYRSSEKAPARSSSTSRQGGSCDDPGCEHAPCVSAREQYRRQMASVQYAAQNAGQYAAPPVQYPQGTTQPVPQYQYPPHVQYAQMPHAATTQAVPTLATTQAIPGLTAQPRPRPASMSRPARPASFHGYSFPTSYTTAHQGPPPSPSAYQVQYAAWAQAYPQAARDHQQTIAYGSMPSSQAVPTYSQPSPIAISPISPVFPTAPTMQPTFSARAHDLGYQPPNLQSQAAPLNRTYSARQVQPRGYPVPGAFPESSAAVLEEDTSGSESSASEYSEDERERDRRARARDHRLSSASASRRPSILKQHTAPLMPTQAAQFYLNHRRESGLEYISSSDNVDSDRTARAVVNRPRTSYTESSRSSRRPSVSTTASSGRTKATTISSMSGLASGLDKMTIERRNGRNIDYLSKRERDSYLHDRSRRESVDRQRMEDDVEAYQNYVRGTVTPEVTASDIQDHYRRMSRSHASEHSRSISRASSKLPHQETIKIESGGTIIHIHPGAQYELKAGEDGKATLHFGDPSGRSKKYHSSSKSSNSRGGRSHTSSDRSSRRKRSIREESSPELSKVHLD